MSDPDSPITKMPSTVEMVTEVIDGLDVNGRHKMVSLGTEAIIDAAMIVIDPQLHDRDALDMIWQQHGEEAISNASFYRWASVVKDRFVSLRKQTRGRVKRASVVLENDQAIDVSARMARGQLLDLLTDKLTDTDDLGEFKPAQLSAMIGLLDDLDRSDQRERELDLKARDLERRMSETQHRFEVAEQHAEKLDAEIALLRQCHAQLPDQLKTLQSRFDALAERVADGETIKPNAFADFGAALRQVAEEFNAQQEAA